MSETNLYARARAELRWLPGSRLPLLLLRHRGLRAADCFLASYPKSGNTWLKFMVGHLVSGRVASFDAEPTEVPMLGEHSGAPSVGPAEGQRLIKTHEARCWPQARWYRKAIYLARDGRDVVVSYYFHQLRFGAPDRGFDHFLGRFLNGRIDGYGAWHRHVISWLDEGGPQLELLLVRYEDLIASPAKELTRVARFLGLSSDPDQISAAVAANAAERMREREQSSPRHLSGAQRDLPLVRRASPGSWTEVFTASQAERFDLRAGHALEQLGYERWTDG